MIKSFNLFINEIYTSNIDDIKDFIDKLGDTITLYRSLILEDGEEIDKDNLGTHWSLDYNFVSNIKYYKSFKHNDEDYITYIITANVNKSDIDIEKTIDKRLIKDSGHFFDELTDELIENPDMDYHPYSHEDEIVLKRGTKPVIVDIKPI